jgi:hypothetical protein
MIVHTGMEQVGRTKLHKKMKYWFTVFCFESDQLRFVNIFSPNEVSILCSVDPL